MNLRKLKHNIKPFVKNLYSADMMSLYPSVMTATIPSQTPPQFNYGNDKYGLSSSPTYNFR